MSNKMLGSALRTGTSSIRGAVSGTAARRHVAAVRCASTAAASAPSRPESHAIFFTETSSPELNDILSTITNKILLPSHLPLEQRKRLFSPKWEQKLRGDPITLQIDGQDLKFFHMDLFRDIPNTRRMLHEAVGRMATRDDFDNLPRLLEGLHSARRRLRPTDYARITRAAGDRGFVHLMIDCARNVKRTGFALDTSQKINEILAYVQARAPASGWREGSTRKALAYARLVVDELLEDESHRPKRRPATGAAAADKKPAGRGFPLNRDPVILAAPLSLAAARAVKHLGGQDEGGEVARRARDLMTLWSPAKGLRQLYPEGSYDAKRDGDLAYLADANKLLVIGAPILHGFDMAMQVVEPELAAEIKSRRDAVAAELRQALEAANPNGRGVQTYNQLFNPQSPKEGEKVVEADE